MGTEDAEIKVSFVVGNPELTIFRPFKLAIDQNIATCASPTARNFFLVLISILLVHSPSFNPSPLPTF